MHTSQSATPKHAICAPRKSGLSRLQLALMGKGPVRAYRPLTAKQADDWADRRHLRGKRPTLPTTPATTSDERAVV